MSETEIPLPNRESAKLKRQEFFYRNSLLIILLGFAGLLRVYKIGMMGVSSQEIQNIATIMNFNRPDIMLANIDNSLYFGLQHLVGNFFGFSVFNFRLTSVFISIVGLYFFFRFVAEWFSKRMGYIALFMISISYFHIALSRAIAPEILFFLITNAFLFYLTKGYRNKSRFYFMIGGILLGLSLYASPAAVFLLDIFLASGVYFFFRNRKFVYSFFYEKSLAIFFFLLLAIPFTFKLVTDPMYFVNKYTFTIDALSVNFQRFIGTFAGYSPEQISFKVGTMNLLDPFVMLSVLVGLIYFLLKIQRRKFFFLVAWFLIFGFYAVIQKTFNYGTISLLLIPIFIFSAFIQNYVFQKWFETFPFNKLARYLLIFAIAVLYALAVTYNLEAYFYAWMKNPDRRYKYNYEVYNSAVGNGYYLQNGNLYPKEVYEIALDTKLQEVTNPNDALNVNFFLIVPKNQQGEGAESSFEDTVQKVEGQDIILYKEKRE